MLLNVTRLIPVLSHGCKALQQLHAALLVWFQARVQLGGQNQQLQLRPHPKSLSQSVKKETGDEVQCPLRAGLRHHVPCTLDCGKHQPASVELGQKASDLQIGEHHVHVSRLHGLTADCQQVGATNRCQISLVSTHGRQRPAVISPVHAHIQMDAHIHMLLLLAWSLPGSAQAHLFIDCPGFVRLAHLQPQGIDPRTRASEGHHKVMITAVDQRPQPCRVMCMLDPGLAFALLPWHRVKGPKYTVTSGACMPWLCKFA